MRDKAIKRREFLKGALAGGAVAAGCTSSAGVAPGKSTSPAPPSRAAARADAPLRFFTAAEAAFVAAMVDHMVPADELSPKGSDLGVCRRRFNTDPLTPVES